VSVYIYIKAYFRFYTKSSDPFFVNAFKGENKNRGRPKEKRIIYKYISIYIYIHFCNFHSQTFTLNPRFFVANILYKSHSHFWLPVDEINFEISKGRSYFLPSPSCCSRSTSRTRFMDNSGKWDVMAIYIYIYYMKFTVTTKIITHINCPPRDHHHPFLSKSITHRYMHI